MLDPLRALKGLFFGYLDPGLVHPDPLGPERAQTGADGFRHGELGIPKGPVRVYILNMYIYIYIYICMYILYIHTEDVHIKVHTHLYVFIHRKQNEDACRLPQGMLRCYVLASPQSSAHVAMSQRPNAHRPVVVAATLHTPALSL